MGNSSSRGKGHWTDSSNVLMDSLRTTTRPMPKSPDKAPPKPPIQVEAAPAHIAATTGSAEMPLGKGFYARVDGPSAELGARKTPGGGYKAGAQLNAGGVAVGHKNEHHDFSVGAGIGRGPGGVELHPAPMPGATVSAGPITVSARSTALAQPVDPHTAEMMKIMGSH